MQEEDCFAVNRWILPHLKDCRPRRFRARISRITLVYLGFLAFVCGGVCAPVARADDAVWLAARELARKLEGQLDPKQTISIQIQDLTGELSTTDRASVITAFASEMLSRGVHVIFDGTVEPTVRMTLSATPNSRLWTAEFIRDAKPQVVILPLVRGDGRVVPTETGSVRIERHLIFEQADPILDFAIIKRQDAAPSRVLIMGTEDLALFDHVDGNWRLTKSIPIPHETPIPRDPRGILFVHKQNDTFFVGTFGTTCDGDLHSGLSIKCRTPSFGWSFAIAPDAIFIEGLVENRNYFQPINSGDQVPSEKAGNLTVQRANSFSWESWGGPGGVIIEALLDGRIWLQVGEERSHPINLNLGSDIARIGGGCVDNASILVTGSSDYTTTDRVQVFHVSEKRLVAVGESAEFPGPIRVLQVSFSSDPVRAVVRNLKTGNYEAYEITLACDR